MPQLFHSSLLDHQTSIWRGVQTATYHVHSEGLWKFI